jgi:hypothetical protein
MDVRQEIRYARETRNLGISANTGNNIIFPIGNGVERMRIGSGGIIELRNYLYIFNPTGNVTHFPFADNNQNCIRGKLNENLH